MKKTKVSIKKCQEETEVLIQINHRLCCVHLRIFVEQKIIFFLFLRVSSVAITKINYTITMETVGDVYELK
jgi:hypothetical protein